MSNSRPLAYDRVQLFGPTPINLLVADPVVNTVTIPTNIFELNDQDTKFFPTSIVLETAYARGTTATDPVVIVDNGTTGENITASLTITDALDNQGRYNPLAFVANPFVINGSRKLRFVKSTVGAGQATATRSRTSGVATIVTAAAHGFTTGDTITIASMTDSSFNDVQAEVTVVDSTTFTYANAGVNVASGADTAGRVGALYVNAYVVGIYY
jgi:hypothetical protein